MKNSDQGQANQCPFSRRSFFTMSAALGTGLCLSPAAPGLAQPAPPGTSPNIDHHYAFRGLHQAGIDTPQQRHTYFAAIDLLTENREELIAVLRAWTDAADRMSRGLPIASITDSYDPGKTIIDSGEAADLGAQRLTMTFGFGPGLFSKDGKDRYGLSRHRPEALVDLPHFPGDQLIEARTGGDISIQACADDPQVAFHAVRQFLRIASGISTLRWVQTGFQSGDGGKETPRNLMGFKDGTQTPNDLDKFVWVEKEGPRWMQGGSYLVVRRIRIALEHWDRMNIGFQEQVIGREKISGAPLGAQHETDPLPLQATDKDGNFLISDTAHVRLANATTNNGAQMLRRGYSYNEGVNFVAERWPPWRQAMEYDAGLLFISYQKDPRISFIPMFAKMSRMDLLNQFATHTGGGIFACPGGIVRGEYLGQHLFEG